MSSEAFGWLVVASAIGLTAGLVGWFARPKLRSHFLLRGLLVASASALILEAAFFALLIATLAGMPDMSQF